MSTKKRNRNGTWTNSWKITWHLLQHFVFIGYSILNLKYIFLIIRILVKCLHINKKNSSKCTLIFLTIYNTDVFLMCQMELISYNEVLRTIIVPANVLIWNGFTDIPNVFEMRWSQWSLKNSIPPLKIWN